MIDFYNTVGGRRFIDHTLPSLIVELQRVAVGLDRLSDLLEGARREAAGREAPHDTPKGDRG